MLQQRPQYFPGREIELFCTCYVPETFGNLVECEQCNNRFHLYKGLLITPSEATIGYANVVLAIYD